MIIKSYNNDLIFDSKKIDMGLTDNEKLSNWIDLMKICEDNINEIENKPSQHICEECE